MIKQVRIELKELGVGCRVLGVGCRVSSNWEVYLFITLYLPLTLYITLINRIAIYYDLLEFTFTVLDTVEG